MLREEVVMTGIIDARSKRHPLTQLAAGLAVSAILLLGTFASAYAEDHRGERHERRDHDRGNWNRGYYAPPVIYGPSPYYYPPPVVYGPGIGINIGIR
jgi:hypothetical protein